MQACGKEKEELHEIHQKNIPKPAKKRYENPNDNVLLTLQK